MIHFKVSFQVYFRDTVFSFTSEQKAQAICNGIENIFCVPLSIKSIDNSKGNLFAHSSERNASLFITSLDEETFIVVFFIEVKTITYLEWVRSRTVEIVASYEARNLHYTVTEVIENSFDFEEPPDSIYLIFAKYLEKQNQRIFNILVSKDTRIMELEKFLREESKVAPSPYVSL